MNNNLQKSEIDPDPDVRGIPAQALFTQPAHNVCTVRTIVQTHCSQRVQRQRGIQ